MSSSTFHRFTPRAAAAGSDEAFVAQWPLTLSSADAGAYRVELDEAANEAGALRIATPGSRVQAWRIATNEELMIARHTRSVLAG